MNDTPFSPEDIERLSREMDIRLAELLQSGDALKIKGPKRGDDDLSISMPEKEIAIVEQAITKAGKDPKDFWHYLKKASFNRICAEDGMLREQSKKWGDISSKSVIEQYSLILAGMGFSGSLLGLLTVVLGANFLFVGIDAWCMMIKDRMEEGKK